MASIIKIESLREFKNKTSSENEADTRYYISSRVMTAKRAFEASRNHWQIENKLHWILDMNLDEDISRVHKKHAPENMAIVRHTALNMSNYFKTSRKLKISFRRTQNKLAWNERDLDSVLSQAF